MDWQSLVALLHTRVVTKRQANEYTADEWSVVQEAVLPLRASKRTQPERRDWHSLVALLHARAVMKRQTNEYTPNEWSVLPQAPLRAA
jgi:hypothetical protein